MSSSEELVEEARAGRMFILVDDEDRENEGDLIIPADATDAAAINFMAKHGRGLICLAMAKPMIERLGLPLMTSQNASRHRTAFTLSIEARDGITTGISAADRARTVAAAIAPGAGPHDIVTPGHIFPLQARDGGVLERAGHTEAAVDIARRAGLTPAAVLCEIMNDDGTMARLPDLIAFAQRHGLKIGTIADLIAYRRRTETLVERRLETTLDSRYGGAWRLAIYVNTVNYAEHVALIKGEISASGGGPEPVLVRMHALNVLEDVMGDTAAGGAGALHGAMRLIGEAGRGVVVLIREPRPDSLTERLRARMAGQDAAVPAAGPDGGKQLRDYGIGAQILLDLGVRRMVLLTNTEKTVVGLDGYGLDIVEQRPVGAG